MPDDAMQDWLNRRRNAGARVPVPLDPAAYREFTVQAFPGLFPGDDEDSAIPPGLYPRDSDGSMRSLALPSSLLARNDLAVEAEAAAEAVGAVEGESESEAWLRQRRAAERSVPGLDYRFRETGGVPFVNTVEGPVAAQALRGATLGLSPDPGAPVAILDMPEAGPDGLPIVPFSQSPVGAGPSERRTIGQVAGDAGMWTLRQVGSALEPLTLLQDVFFATVADIAERGRDRRVRFNGEPVDDRDIDDLVNRVRTGAISGEFSLPDGTVVDSFGALDYLDGLPGGVWQNLSQIEWGNYAPGGVAPNRPVDGAELLTVLGVENEQAQKWGGIAVDLVVDPLLLGATLRVAGRGLNALGRTGGAADDVAGAIVPRVPGGGGQLGAAADDVVGAIPRVFSTAEEAADFERIRAAGDAAAAASAARSGLGDPLIRLGNAIDNAMNIGGHARVAWNADNVVANATREFVERRVEMAWTAIQGGDGLLAAAGRRAVDLFATPRARANILMGDAGRPGVGPLEGSAARTFGEQVVLNEALGAARGARVADEAVRESERLLREVLGMRSTGYFQRIMGALRGLPRTLRNADDLPEVVRQTMLMRAYEVVDSGGVLMHSAPDKSIQALMDGAVGAEAWNRWSGSFDAARTAIREAAGTAGITDPARLTRLDDQFRQLVEGLTRIDSRLGFEMSGYSVARDRFFKAFMEDTGSTLQEAQEAWTSVLTARLRDGVSINDLRIARNPDGGGFIARADYGEAEGVMSPFASVGDFLQQDTLFNHLDLDVFIDSLRDGHLRRAYGVWTDPSNLNSLESAFASGRIVRNSTLAEHQPQRALADRPELLEDFNSYLEALGGTGRPTAIGEGLTAGRDHFIVRRDSMIQHLTERGVERGLSNAEATRQAMRAWDDVVFELQGEPMQRVLREVHDRVANYQMRYANSGLGTQGFAAFRAREDISDAGLELLGEMMDPWASILESAQTAQRVIPFQDFMRSTYEAGIKSGHVVRRVAGEGKGKYVDANGVAYQLIPESGSGVWGGFASGNGAEVWVHPQLFREIQGVMKGGGNVNSGVYQRIRSAIAGGYLASPNMAFVNLSGAIYSSTIGLDGANPIPLLRNMGAVAREIFDGDSPWLRKLNEFIPAGDLTQAATTVARRDLASLRLESAGTGGFGAGAAVRHLAEWYENLIKAPGNLRLAGLDGFQLIDQWVRTAAFKTHYERLRAGGRSGLVADAFDDASALAEAAELARLSALDYTELPKALTQLRDTGLVMFPGFPFLMVQRNISAALSRPAGLAVYDRVQDAITSAVVDPAERAALYAGMDEWLLEAGGAPITQYTDENGDVHWRVIPIGDILPTRTRFGTPMMENIGGLGLYGPLVDIFGAFLGRGGEAMLGGQYGQRVFDVTDSPVERVGNVGAFLYNSFAPAFARRLYAPGGAGTGGARGLLPQAGRSLVEAAGVDLEPGLAESMYSLSEHERLRADRGFLGELIATFLRSPQTVTSSGPLASIQRTYAAAEREMNLYTSGIQQEIRAALAAGNKSKVERLQREHAQRVVEFNELWTPVIRILQDANERARQRRNQQ